MARKTGKKVGIYARLSIRRTDEAGSIERQVAACRAWAKARGWEVVGKPYIDNNLSGYDKSTVRPAFDRLKADAAAGIIDAVVVWKIDRFGRRMTGNLQSIDELVASGASFHAVTDPLDNVEPGVGQILLALLSWVAEQSSADTSKRVRAAFTEHVERGQAHGGPRVFGYSKQSAAAKGGLQLDPKESKVARKIIDRLLAGESYRSLARWLNDHGHTTTQGKRWNAASLRQWAVSPTIAGIRRHEVRDKDTGKVISYTETPGDWPAIITAAEREQVLTRRALDIAATTPTEVRHLLAGVVCCSCGGRMDGKKVNGTYRYLCRAAGCGRGINEKQTDDYVVEQLLGYLATAELSPVEGQDPEMLRTAIAEAEQSLADVNRAHFVEKKTDGTPKLNEPQWETLTAELEATLSAARDELAASTAPTSLHTGTADELVAWWAAASIGERRTAVREAFHRVTIHPATRMGGVFDTDRIELSWRLFSGVGQRVMKKAQQAKPTELVGYGTEEEAEAVREAQEATFVAEVEASITEIREAIRRIEQADQTDGRRPSSPAPRPKRGTGRRAS